jgi:hypothetical protein
MDFPCNEFIAFRYTTAHPSSQKAAGTVIALSPNLVGVESATSNAKEANLCKHLIFVNIQFAFLGSCPLRVGAVYNASRFRTGEGVLTASGIGISSRNRE